MVFTTNASISTFGGKLVKLSHNSPVNGGTKMDLNVYFPPCVKENSCSHQIPVLFYLSGLTCTGDNCAEKGFIHAYASKYNIAIVYPDTSPRGNNIPGENDSWDFGTGAGFYIDATKSPYKGIYNMYSYISKELPSLLFKEYPFLDESRVSITGHSMGGHGALTIFLLNPGKYKSVSAFSPISNPSKCPWGEKAFSGYFGEDKSKWLEHDATELIKSYKGPKPEILIDVGTADSFYLNKQLLPENFAAAAEEGDYKNVNIRYQNGYDHSYYFISTFAGDHVAHAAKYLNVSSSSSL